MYECVLVVLVGVGEGEERERDGCACVQSTQAGELIENFQALLSLPT